MPKISYILSTNRDLAFSSQTLSSILTLPEHDREIVICCPLSAVRPEYQEKLDSFKIKIVEDDKCNGSIYPFNKAYKHTDGDYVALMVDDIAFPPNYLDMLEWMESPFMKRKRFRISNSLWDGGPGLVTYGHDALEDGTSLWGIEMCNHPVDIKKCPYAVLPLPVLWRDTVEKELSGHIFNPLFNHHYPDHWLGFYCTRQEVYEPYKWRCPTIKYIMLKDVARTLPHYDTHDRQVLKELTDKFILGETKYV